jgi:Zn-dependent protease
VVVTFLSGQWARASRPGLSAALAYGFGLTVVLTLVVSVLLHEIGHALVARRLGIGVRGITLELLGGYTEMDTDAPTPRTELLVALAGPVVSLALGLLCGGVVALAPRGSLAFDLALQLCLGNLLIAVFNALPGLPLDGGRALRAAVWWITGDRHRGTEVAGWAGRVVAAVTGLATLVGYSRGVLSQFGLLFTGLIALTLWFGATQAIRAGRVGRRIPALRVGALARPLYRVPTGTPLAEAQRRAAEHAGAGAAIGVTDADGQVVALVTAPAAEAVPAGRRPWIGVDAVARAVDRRWALPDTLAGADVIRAVRANPADEYLVTSGDDVVGVLRLADLARQLDARGTAR